MRPIRIFGILLIVVSMAFGAIGVLVPHAVWYVYFAFMSTVAGYILATGDFGRFSAPAAGNDTQRMVALKKAKPGDG